MLIAESGSTKTDWRWIDEDHKVHQFQTKGMNPNYSTSEELEKELKKVVLNFPYSKNDELFFYGSGCEYVEENHWFTVLIRQFFKGDIHIHGDALAAARASLGDASGIAVILGTGANVSLYNENKIVSSYSGYGYILGDEGSGAYLGKLLLKDVLEDRCPEEIKSRLVSYFKWDKKSIIHQLYKQPQPNRFMSNLAIYIHKNRKNEYFKQLILKSFDDFFQRNVLPYPELKGLPVGAVGSIAYFFELYFKHKAEEYGFQVCKIVQSPIAALTLYHLGE